MHKYDGNTHAINQHLAQVEAQHAAQEAKTIECETFDGTGEIDIRNFSDLPTAGLVDCPDCEGEGVIHV